MKSVYIVAGLPGRGVKVGISEHMAKRLSALQCTRRFRLNVFQRWAPHPKARAIEAEAHRLLGHHRIEGEWFDVTPEAAVAAVQQAIRAIGGDASSYLPYVRTRRVDPMPEDPPSPLWAQLVAAAEQTLRNARFRAREKAKGQ